MIEYHNPVSEFAKDGKAADTVFIVQSSVYMIGRYLAILSDHLRTKKLKIFHII